MKLTDRQKQELITKGLSTAKGREELTRKMLDPMFVGTPGGLQEFLCECGEIVTSSFFGSCSKCGDG